MLALLTLVLDQGQSGAGIFIALEEWGGDECGLDKGSELEKPWTENALGKCEFP